MSELPTPSPSSEKLKFRLTFAGVITGTALGITWFLLAERSPLHDYFSRHYELPEIWSVTVFIPYVLAAMISGNPHSPLMVILIFALAIEWFLFGLLISGPIFKLKSRSKRDE